MTIFRVRCYRHGGETDCGGLRSRCHIRVRIPDQAVVEKRDDFFIHTAMTKEERENIHDDTLVKLTDDVNKLIREAEKKRPDKQIGIMYSHLGFFFRYNSITLPNEEWFKNATEITDENVQELLKLTPK